MQTPLPKKIEAPVITLSGSTISYNAPLSQEASKINQLITYLAELSEVAEGKPTYADGYEQGKFDAEMDKLNKVPPLKETLLNDLADLTWYIKNEGVDEIENGVNYVKVKDVEAIINRLIP